MAEATTGYYRSGESWLHRRSPITKLLALGLVLLASFALPPAALAPLLFIIVLAGWSAGLLRPMLASLRIPIVLFASIVLVNAFFFPGARDVIVQLGPAALTSEGLAFGVISAGRLLVVFLASVLFLFTTLADDILESLVARGVSHRLAFVVLSVVQMVPRMQARAGAILEAQQARGLPITGSILTRARALVPLIGPVILGSLIDVRERTFALEARGFGTRPDRTSYRRVTDPPADRWLRVAIVVAAVAVVGAVVLGLGR
ncbi:MAG TPA: energy-coupling factor transporter transmembrane component T [Candidatus Saccharimonadia bacterium]|nr:energy-coupling factor transporter transmembrane component T [Candidatus Saccharimonadia bacterium]